PPTPPRPTMATRLPWRTACFWGLISPRWRANASWYDQPSRAVGVPGVSCSIVGFRLGRPLGLGRFHDLDLDLAPARLLVCVRVRGGGPDADLHPEVQRQVIAAVEVDQGLAEVKVLVFAGGVGLRPAAAHAGHHQGDGAREGAAREAVGGDLGTLSRGD